VPGTWATVVGDRHGARTGSAEAALRQRPPPAPATGMPTIDATVAVMAKRTRDPTGMARQPGHRTS